MVSSLIDRVFSSGVVQEIRLECLFLLFIVVMDFIVDGCDTARRRITLLQYRQFLRHDLASGL